MIDKDFLNQLSRFSLIVRKRVTSNYAGSRRSTSVGRGLTINDYRQYIKGDDLRLISWKFYARTNELFIKQFEEEKTLAVHVIVDKSASMNFGKDISKFEYASMIGLGYAYLAMKDNDRFEFTTFSEDINPLKPRRGMSQVAAIVDILNKLKVHGNSRFEESMARYSKFVTTKSLVVVISDFLVNIDEIRRGLQRLGKHELRVIQVLDREEVDLKIEGDLNLHDSETGTTMRTFISRRMRDKYKHLLDDHTANIHNLCNTLNADFYQVVTDTPIFDAFYHVLKQ